MDPSAFFKGGDVGLKFLRTDVIAEKFGVAEPPLRFFIGIILGYPMAICFLLISKTPLIRHLYISLCGMFISYFCFGTDSAYILLSIIVTYASLILFGGTIYHVIFTFVFQMGYLFGSYLFYASDGYDVKWTTPQCILCLRLIGLAWDCYDGKQPKENLRGDLKTTCYNKTPTLVEILGYSYFFGGFMAGPQFSFQRYTSFVNGSLVDEEGLNAPNSRFVTALKRTLAGIASMLVFLQYDHAFPCNALLTEEFANKSFFAKSTQITLTYHIHFCKYVSIWSFSESACIITGLSYNGTKNGKSKWDGVRNFKFRTVLFGPFFQDMLEGFNINTSQWAGRYVFRRLMFLRNKTISHILTLLFLSLWHGFYVGYLILFGIEFLLIIAERQFCDAIRTLFSMTYSEQPLYIKLPVRVCNALFRAYACGFAASAFMLLRWRRIKLVYAAVSYWLIIVIVSWYIVIIILQTIIKSKRKEKKEE